MLRAAPASASASAPARASSSTSTLALALARAARARPLRRPSRAAPRCCNSRGRGGRGARTPEGPGRAALCGGVFLPPRLAPALAGACVAVGVAAAGAPWALAGAREELMGVCAGDASCEANMACLMSCRTRGAQRDFCEVRCRTPAELAQGPGELATRARRVTRDELRTFREVLEQDAALLAEEGRAVAEGLTATVLKGALGPANARADIVLRTPLL